MAKMIVGNWKMNTVQASAVALARAIAVQLAKEPLDADLVLAPPFPYLRAVSDIIRDTPVALSGQNCHSEAEGAFTGGVSAAMLRDVGCSFVILGHSECRSASEQETAHLPRKVQAASEAGLQPIFCIGETMEERKAGRTTTVLKEQMTAGLPSPLALDSQGDSSLVIAYEPRWAIGSGVIPSLDDIEKQHKTIRRICAEAYALSSVRVLYGGSVAEENAGALLSSPEIAGVLVGGASLNPGSFLGIARKASGPPPRTT